MRTLHVAALPFPSPQGTQGLVRNMLRALGDSGHDTHLLCYAHGAPELAAAQGARDEPFTVHRLRARGFTSSLRSGPSLDKLWLDAALVAALRGLWRRLQPDLLVAHHVEAAACALALGLRFVFVAHTSLAHELPTYVPAWLAALTRGAGRRLDAFLVRRAAHAAAVSPILADLLARQSGCEVAALPLPWPAAPASTPEERVSARVALGLLPEHEVALYAGNLDAYQGLDGLLPGLSLVAAQRPAFRWVVATASDPAAFHGLLRTHGLAARAQFVSLAGEAARRRLHAAADLALIPRRALGGVPIKLLEALARSVPVVAAQTALAGYPLADACELIVDTTPDGWAAAIARSLDESARAHERAAGGRAYIERAHRAGNFVAALARLVELGAPVELGALRTESSRAGGLRAESDGD